MHTRTIAVIVGILVIGGGIFWFITQRDSGFGNDANEAQRQIVSDVVDAFGTRLQDVSLTAPEEDVVEQIRTAYSDLVAPDLLVAWMDDPSHAPGRETSSPWPDRIEVNDVQALEADAYIVSGEVVYMTSVEESEGGDAGREPVWVFVERRGGFWLIADYRTQQPRILWNEHQHDEPSFSVRYPDVFTFSETAPEERGDTFWSELSDEAGQTHVTLALGSSLQPDTNFSRARLTVSNAEVSGAACTEAPATESEEVVLGDTAYTKLAATDAAAGSRHDIISYRTEHDGTCWAVETTVQWSPLENYAEGEVTAFDRERVNGLLVSVVESVSLNN